MTIYELAYKTWGILEVEADSIEEAQNLAAEELTQDLSFGMDYVQRTDSSGAEVWE